MSTKEAEERGTKERYSFELPDGTRFEFGGTFPEALADIDVTTRETTEPPIERVVRRELVIPKDPLGDASYLLLFPPDKTKLKDSLLFRITGFAQSFRGLMQHPTIDQITDELRRIYDNEEHERVKTSITIPYIPNIFVYCRTPPTERYKHWKTRAWDLGVITPRKDGSSLAEAFETVFEKYDALPTLEKEGRDDLRRHIEGEVTTVEALI